MEKGKGHRPGRGCLDRRSIDGPRRAGGTGQAGVNVVLTPRERARTGMRRDCESHATRDTKQKERIGETDQDATVTAGPTGQLWREHYCAEGRPRHTGDTRG